MIEPRGKETGAMIAPLLRSYMSFFRAVFQEPGSVKSRQTSFDENLCSDSILPVPG